MANPLVHLKNKILSFLHYIRGKLRYSQEPLKVNYITMLSPYLVEACHLLIHKQQENGSWEDDPLITSLVVDSLYRAFNMGLRCSGIKRAIIRGVTYLRQELMKISKEVIRGKELYPSLDRNSRVFFQMIQTLNMLGDTIVNDRDVKKALSAIFSALSQYCFALDSPQVVSTALVTALHLSISPDESIRRLLDYAIISLFAKKARDPDVVILAYPLILWGKEYSNLIVAIYQRYFPSEQATYSSIIDRIKERALTAIKEILSRPFINVELLVHTASLLGMEELKDDVLLNLLRERIIRKVQKSKLDTFLLNHSMPTGQMALLCQAMVNSGLITWYVLSEEQQRKLRILLNECVRLFRYRKEKRWLKGSIIALLVITYALLLIINYYVAQVWFGIFVAVVPIIITILVGIILKRY